MSTSGIIAVLLCAEIVVSVHHGRLDIKEPPLHLHPTLVALVEMNNMYRSQHGLPKQAVSPYLTEIAQAHAQWMADTGRFEHNYEHPYPEIILWNARSIAGAFDGWMNSSPHRAIILNGSTHVGYGYAIAASGETYWCGVFGNVESRKIATTTPPATPAELASSRP